MFSERLTASIDKNRSFLLAGFDPDIAAFPAFVLQRGEKLNTADEFAYNTLTYFYKLALQALSGSIAAIKPNLAFFEQYGLAGIRALYEIVAESKSLSLPVILDAKRGDISSTAKAYSASLIGKSVVANRVFQTFDADAVTVNPFLGFDSIHPFLDDCKKYGKGIFVLVKTSNPDAFSIQNDSNSAGITLSEKIANWVAENGTQLCGVSGYSGLGAVVGATHPNEARTLRKLMPKSFFLIPGLGAQGARAADAVAGFGADKRGAIVNVSRGLLGNLTAANEAGLIAEIKARADNFNAEIKKALSV